jgi:16S rRNA processing protein RimM
MPQEELILIAKVRRSHGVKGEVLLETFVMDDKRFKKLKRVFLRDAKGKLEEKQVTSARLTANGVLIKFEGIDDRDEADELRAQEVTIPISERAKLPAGQAYYDEIIGMDVIDDASDEKLGVVRDVLEMPAGEVYVLEMNDGREHLLSSMGEEVKKLDVKKNSLRVSLLEDY